ncbi:MAG: DUF1080 domain-containing protein [Bacteroidales bacterium]|nr:DUF1080 domain-containing protein [Bacteroidales bacterium]
MSCKVKTETGGIADILIHSNALKNPAENGGYAIRIKNTYDGYGAEDGLMLTGSLNRIRNVYYPMVRDNEWFHLNIEVNNKTIKVFINNVLVNNYTEPENAWRPENLKNRLLSSGTIALYHSKGKVYFSDLTFTDINGADQPAIMDPGYDKLITGLHAQYFPLIDFHVHLKGGLTIEDVVALSQKLGINFGVAANCGLHFPVTNNRELNAYLNSIQNAATYKGMQAEGREWMTLFSPDTAARFDYIFTDAMTWTNKNGKRLRLWIKEETEVGNPEDFMEELVSKIEHIVQEPIDIYVNSSFIPEEIQSQYNQLWTAERMDRVIKALVKNNVALEINSRYKIPSIEFLKRAKSAGVKFTFGTNNTGKDDINYEYCFEVLEKVGLTTSDMWMPRKPGERKIQKLVK